MIEAIPQGDSEYSFSEGDVLAKRYRILGAIGAGASGAVYVAERLDIEVQTKSPESDGSAVARIQAGTRVALKVIHRHLVRDYQIFKRFHREARILRKLEGPHLVPILDFGEASEGQLFMALELVEGEALDQVLKRGPLEPERAMEVMAEICAGLEIAHDLGVVHRDLKPGNVLLDEQAQGRARVLDFGMAKLLQGSGSTSLTALTERNMVFGTPEYMAPEQARGDDVDPRSDVYAAGVMLYEMLTGKVPFTGNTPISIMTAHLMEDVPPPSSRTTQKLPPALEAIVLHAMAKDPEERYPTARDLGEALRAALENPADVASITPPPLLAHADTQHALHVPESLSATKRANAIEVRGEHVPRAEDNRTWIWVAIIAALLGIATGVAVSLGGGT